jgi:hypothetical protein
MVSRILILSNFEGDHPSKPSPWCMFRPEFPQVYRSITKNASVSNHLSRVGLSILRRFTGSKRFGPQLMLAWSSFKRTIYGSLSCRLPLLDLRDLGAGVGMEPLGVLSCRTWCVDDDNRVPVIISSFCLKNNLSCRQSWVGICE